MSIWIQTKREKLGTIDGMNLFFGALLGANLGTIDALPLWDYVQLIVLLAGMVMTIRVVSTSERRVYAAATVVLYVALMTSVLLVPTLRPDGLAPGDLQRLIATLVIWLVATLLVEFWPTRESPES
jgi:hypothetical protein